MTETLIARLRRLQSERVAAAPAASSRRARPAPAADPSDSDQRIPDAMIAVARAAGGKALPDNAQYHHRMEIRSETSGALYIVAQDKKTGEHKCSCRGWIRHRHCKHLTAVLPLLLTAYGGRASLPREASSSPRPMTGRSRLRPGEAERRKAERARRTWEGVTHGTYNPAVEGFGSVDDWIAVAEAATQGRGAFKRPAAKQRSDHPDLKWFDLLTMPTDVAELKSAYRRACLKYHPDTGGNAGAFHGMLQAFKRLLQSY